MLTHLSPVAAGVPDQIFLIIEPVDMRLGIDGLSACIQSRLKSTPCRGGFYLFSNARRNRWKLPLWDGTGVWLAQRRLHQGRFVWPRADSAEVLTHPHLCLSTEAWQWLIAGVDWTRLSSTAEAHQHWQVS